MTSNKFAIILRKNNAIYWPGVIWFHDSDSYLLSFCSVFYVARTICPIIGWLGLYIHISTLSTFHFKAVISYTEWLLDNIIAPGLHWHACKSCLLALRKRCKVVFTEQGRATTKSCQCRLTVPGLSLHHPLWLNNFQQVARPSLLCTLFASQLMSASTAVASLMLLQ